MNISLPTKLLLNIAVPQITGVVKDIVLSQITSENLTGIKKKLYTLVSEVTGKTSFTWDDRLAEVVLDIITTQSVFAAWGDPLLDIVEEWIASSETPWDDTLLQPVISIVREVAGIPDGEK